MAGSPEIEEIVMRIAQVADKRGHGDRLRIGGLVVGMHIHHSQKSRRIDPAVEADLADGLVAEPSAIPKRLMISSTG